MMRSPSRSVSWSSSSVGSRLRYQPWFSSESYLRASVSIGSEVQSASGTRVGHMLAAYEMTTAVGRARAASRRNARCARAARRVLLLAAGGTMTRKHRGKRLELALETIQLLVLD